MRECTLSMYAFVHESGDQNFHYFMRLCLTLTDEMQNKLGISHGAKRGESERALIGMQRGCVCVCVNVCQCVPIANGCFCFACG